MPPSVPARAAFRTGRDLLARLRSPDALVTVELRPPRRAAAEAEREPWIDLYHAVRRLTARDTLVFTTDNAVGAREEENLRHLATNLGGDADLSRAVPFLTVKHPLPYCLRFPERAAIAGHRAVVVVGGDAHDGVARCVPHASDLRRELRARHPGVALGGWINPHRDAGWQADLLAAARDATDFVLTQVVSHHDLGAVERLLAALEARGIDLPLLFGVFHYRSGRLETLAQLARLMPVPVDGLRREFDAGCTAGEVCARTVAALASLGVRRIYVCNLPPARAPGQVAELGELLVPSRQRQG